MLIPLDIMASVINIYIFSGVTRGGGTAPSATFQEWVTPE